MTDLLTYPPGIPTYLALWLPLAPLLVLAAVRFRVPFAALLVLLATTLPSFILHPPSALVPGRAGWPVLMLIYVCVGIWLARRAAAIEDPSATREPHGIPWKPVVALAALAFAVRIPWAWLDPGISDIPRASATAATDLLSGTNPYVVPNEHTVVGTYQYPAAGILLHVPFEALLPFDFAGEEWFSARAVLWAWDAAVVSLAVVAGARTGRPDAGVIVGLLYALHPTLVRLSAMTVANDLLLGGAALGSAVALARGRVLLAAVGTGIAISFKPAAATLLPLLLAAGGWRLPVMAVGAAAVLQLPFMVWPEPGLHGFDAITEPALRATARDLGMSVWGPVAVLTDMQLGRVLTAVGVVLASLVALWAGSQLRSNRAVPRVVAAYGLTLLATMVFGGQLRLNFEGWYLPALVTVVGLSATGRHPPVSATRPAVAGSGRGRGHIE